MNPGLVLTQIPVQDKGMEVKAGSQNLSWAGWFEGARIVLVSPGNRVRVLSKGFSAAADPEISFDGQRVVFAGKKDPRAPWAVWETTLAGGACRQVTKDAGDCRNPVYLSSLYTLDSPEPWFTVLYVGREETFDESGAVRLTSLHSVKLDGGEPRRLTFNPKGDLDPVQTGDGRVIYAGWRGSGGLEPGERRRSLFSLNIDGTDQELYGGEQGKRFQGMPCATEGGLVVFVEADHPTRDGSGQLGVMEQRRPHHSYRQVTQDQGFAFLYPSLLGGNKILVSRRPTASEGRWGVYELDLETGQIESVLDSPGYHAVQAKALRARPVPDGRSTVVEPGVKTGILYVLNIYEADEHLASCLTPGSVSRVRLTEAVPAPAPRANLDAPSRICFGRRLLGEALVEKDGSLHLLVPADTPLELQALDANGLALASCRWIWVKPKENRGCIGCHEDHELVPENLYVLAVQRPASDLTPLPEQRRSVGFREQILPLLQARCAAAACHEGPATPLPVCGRQTGSAEADARSLYETLLAQKPPRSTNYGAGNAYVEPGQARNSLLVWRLLGRDMSRTREPAESAPPGERALTKMPPIQAAPLTPEELRTFIEWIDLGAMWETPTTAAPALARKTINKAPARAAGEPGGM